MVGVRYSVQNTTEIGVQTGQSLLMWHSYFRNAQIWGVDVAMPKSKAPLTEPPATYSWLVHEAKGFRAQWDVARLNGYYHRRPRHCVAATPARRLVCD